MLGRWSGDAGKKNVRASRGVPIEGDTRRRVPVVFSGGGGVPGALLERGSQRAASLEGRICFRPRSGVLTPKTWSKTRRTRRSLILLQAGRVAGYAGDQFKRVLASGYCAYVYPARQGAPSCWDASGHPFFVAPYVPATQKTLQTTDGRGSYGATKTRNFSRGCRPPFTGSRGKIRPHGSAVRGCQPTRRPAAGRPLGEVFAAGAADMKTLSELSWQLVLAGRNLTGRVGVSILRVPPM